MLGTEAETQLCGKKCVAHTQWEGVITSRSTSAGLKKIRRLGQRSGHWVKSQNFVIPSPGNGSLGTSPVVRMTPCCPLGKMMEMGAKSAGYQNCITRIVLVFLCHPEKLGSPSPMGSGRSHCG